MDYEGSIFETFSRKTEMKWQIIMTLMMVFRLFKMDHKYKNWAEQIARWKLFHKLKKYKRAIGKQRSWNLVFAGLY